MRHVRDIRQDMSKSVILLSLPKPAAVAYPRHSADNRIAKRERLATGRGAHCVEEQVGTNDDEGKYEVPADLGEVRAGVRRSQKNEQESEIDENEQHGEGQGQP